MRGLSLSLFTLINFIFLNVNAVELPYSVNLMWINKNIVPEQEFVAPVQDRNQANIQNSLFNWAQLNPSAKEVNFWFDSQFTTEEQIVRTQEYFDTFNQGRGTDSKLHLRDLRSWLKETYPEEESKNYFSAETLVYLRVDLLRLMISYKEVTSCQEKCASVYADVDVTPTGKETLFNQDTMNGLEEFGIAFKKAFSGFENSAHILTNLKENMLIALNEAIIQATFMKLDDYTKIINIIKLNLAKKQLDDQKYDEELARTKKIQFERIFGEAQMIYVTSIPIMFLYYKFLEKDFDEMKYYRYLPTEGRSEWQSFTQEVNNKNNLSILSSMSMPAPGIFKFIDLEKNKEKLSTFQNYFDLKFPIVNLDAPPIKYKYDE